VTKVGQTPLTISAMWTPVHDPVLPNQPLQPTAATARLEGKPSPIWRRGS